MIQRGIATFGLDTGRCPRWLFERMVRLGREMVRVIVAEKGPDEFIRRLADPAWFQSLGTVLAFDWNASGLTTILTAALKEAIRGEEQGLGVFICGGKGRTSRKTPEEIQTWGERTNLQEQQTAALVYNSRMAAKVDSALIQDGFQIYHHSFFFTVIKDKRTQEVTEDQNARTHPLRHAERSEASQISSNTPGREILHGVYPERSRRIQDDDVEMDSRLTETKHPHDASYGVGAWTVVQQGMNAKAGTARRYHWHSQNVTDLVCEPHSGIASDTRLQQVLNLTAGESGGNRAVSTELVSQQSFSALMKDIRLLRKYATPVSQSVQLSLGEERLTLLNLENKEFRWHPVVTEDFSKSRYLEKILWELCDRKPENYEKLLAMEGVGSKTIRALALVAEIIYGAKPSYEDPARYSFAHGGKDATPYPVDRATYDQAIAMMQEFVRKTALPALEKQRMLRSLA